MGMAGILFGILFLSLFIGVPIAISLGVAASLTMMLTNNAQYLASIPTRMFTQLDSFTLMARSSSWLVISWQRVVSLTV